jgi:acyl carrier protein|tara:strand:- start:5166 stop:5414 length:249 start_codon:yes stop_codon:yes gene_type:complete
MNKKIIQNKILRILSSILKADIKKLKEYLKSSKNINNWDSLSHIKIIMAIEEEFNIKFSNKEISKTIDDKDKLIDTVFKMLK